MDKEIILERINHLYDSEPEAERLRKAISETREGIEMAKQLSNVDQVELANALSTQYAELAIMYQLDGDMEKAVEAAITSFEWSAFTFASHPAVIEILLEAEDEECDKLAVEIAGFHEVYFQTRARDGDEAVSWCAIDEITELLQKHAERSKEVKWLLEDFELGPLARAYFEGEIPVSELLAYPARWREEGRDPEECNSAETIFLDFDEQNEKLIEMWQHEDMSRLNSLAAFVRVVMVFLKEGIPLPDTLNFTRKVTDPCDYYEAVKENDRFLMALEIQERDLGVEEEDSLAVRCRKALLPVMQYAFKLCLAFLEDRQEKKRGYAANFKLICDITRRYIEMLSSFGENEEAFEIGNMIAGQFPDIYLALSVSEIGYTLNKPELAMVPIDFIVKEGPIDGGELNITDAIRLLAKKMLLISASAAYSPEEKIDEYEVYFCARNRELKLLDTSLIASQFELTNPNTDDLLQIPEFIQKSGLPLIFWIDLLRSCERMATEHNEERPIFQAITLYLTRYCNSRLFFKAEFDFYHINTVESIEETVRDFESYVASNGPASSLLSRLDLLIAAGLKALYSAGFLSITNVLLNTEKANRDELFTLYGEGNDTLSYTKLADKLFAEAQDLIEQENSASNEESSLYAEKYAIRHGMLVHELYYAKGLLDFLNGDFTNALEHFKHAIEATRKLDEQNSKRFSTRTEGEDNPFLAMTYLALGRSYELIDPKENYSTALHNYTLAMENLSILVPAHKAYGELVYSSRKEASNEERNKAVESLLFYLKTQMENINRNDEEDESSQGNDKEELTKLTIKTAIMLREEKRSSEAKPLVKSMLQIDKRNKRLRGLLKSL